MDHPEISWICDAFDGDLSGHRVYWNAAPTLSGRVDEETFASQCVRLDFEALQRTRDHFIETPLTTSQDESHQFYNWVTSSPGTFEQCKEAFQSTGTNSRNSNFEYFGEYYREALMPKTLTPHPFDSAQEKRDATM